MKKQKQSPKDRYANSEVKRTARLFMANMLASGDNRAEGIIAEDAIRHAKAFEREWKQHGSKE